LIVIHEIAALVRVPAIEMDITMTLNKAKVKRVDIIVQEIV
jgi:hypothetical protein